MKKLFLFFALLLPVLVFSQGHIIGSFPLLDGGIENQPAGGTMSTATLPFSSTQSNYTNSNAAVTATFKSSGGRSGPKYLEVFTGASAQGFYTPTSALAMNTSYVVQYYFRYNSATARGMQVAASPNGGTNFGVSSTVANVINTSAWTKRTEVITSANNTATGFGIIRFLASAGSITTAFDLDDIVVYAGASADVTAPGAATAAVISNASATSQNLSWTAPAGGTDGGGYMVVRYTASPGATDNPKQNGIYALAGSITETVTGTVVYIGTSTSCVSTSLAPGTAYYYKIYTVDKAFNYSSELSTNLASCPSAAISYSGTPFCTSLSTGQAVTRTGTAGGVYSAPAGLIINSGTGAITPSGSTAGTYTVTYTIAAAGGCAAFATTTSVTITTQPFANGYYAGDPYCSNEGTAYPSGTSVGAPGTLSSTAGLTIAPTTGAVTLGTSTPGTYNVVYTVPASGGCAVYSNTTSITITAIQAATISYSGTPFCKSLAAGQPVTRTGTTGGVFSSTAGLSINASTGDITPSTSTAGTYTVTYTMAATGGCAARTTTTSITIASLPSASGTSTETCVGGSTGTITGAASGGTAPYTYSLNAGAYQSDPTFTGLAAGSYTLNAKSSQGCVSSVSVTVNSYANSTDDQNATVTDTWIGHMYDGINFSAYIGQFTEAETFNESFGGSAVCFNVVSNSLTRSIYTESFSVKFRMTSTKKGLYIVDMGSDDGSRLTVDGALLYNNWSDQGYTTRSSVLLSLNGNSSLLYEFYESAGGNQVSFQNLVPVFANALSLNTAQSICLGSTGLAISGDTYGALPAGISLSGTGYQWSYSTTPGGVRTDISGATGQSYTPLTTTAPFNTAGTYYIYRNAILSSTNNVSPNPYTATHESAAATLTVTATPAATISYAGSPFCSSAAAGTVSRTGTVNGSYSAPAGLTMDAVTGEITPASSTAGTYLVTYSMASAGGCAAQTATTSVTITAGPAATFSYAGSPYTANGGTASVTFSGTSGGTYSSTAGLSINATTGTVTLSASTVGTYTVTYSVAAAGGCGLYTTTASITVIVATKTFTGTGNFSDPTKWTDGSLPLAGETLVIDGTCTVDNNAGTDNIAYGALIIGTATGRTLSWAASGTNRLNVLRVSAGAGASTLNMTNGGTLIIRDTWTSTNLAFTPGAGTIEVQSAITLPAAYATYKNLVINAPSLTVTLGRAVTLSGNLVLTAGILNANNFSIIAKGNWTNNASSTAFTSGTGTVTFSHTAAQSIAGTFITSFRNLTIANTGSTVTLHVNASITGNLTVSSGTFDLGIFTANRTIAGGTLTVSNNATLKIGGTNTFPSGYTTNTLVVASTVLYAGANQAVANVTYGNLTLTGSAGAVVKTLPATALVIVGNLTTTVGTATSLSFTAGSNISVTGHVSIGTATTFNGGGYAHTIAGNWTNSGVYNGNTGTVSFTGSVTVIGGPGVQNFNNLTIAASGISFSSGSITLTGSLSIVGAGSSLTQSTGGTLLMTGSGTSISGSNISLNNLTVSGSVTTSDALSLTGNLTVSGTFSATGAFLAMSGASKTISGGGSISFNILSIPGSISTDANFSISSSLDISGSFSASAGTATFTGTSTLSGTAGLFNIIVNGTSFKLSANSVLGIAGLMTITAGTLDVVSASPNTVDFNGADPQNINAITYNNLTLSNASNKTALAGISILNNFTISSGTTFIPGSFTHSISGNWNNYGNFTAGTSTVQFLGEQTTNIYGSTTFHILTINSANAATSVLLQDNVSASTVNMMLGSILTGTDTLTITSDRTGNGIILGNIRRNHAFTTGISYAFEGPYNTITFSAVSSVTSMTVSVQKGSVSDFPFGGSISRVYNISVPAGTYTATLRLHYEDEELNGSNEASMALWNYNGSAWLAIGKTANNATLNYIEQSGLTNISNRWTCSDNSNVVQWNGSVSTDWHTAANWTVLQGSASTPPGATDIVNLGNAAFTLQPAISTAVNVKNVIYGSVQAVTLSMANGGSLTTGAILGTWSNGSIHTINVNDQSITVNGDLNLSDGVSGHAINLNIGAGTVTVMGSLSESGNANITFGGAGTLNIYENFHYTSGTFTAGTGNVNYNGVQNQDVADVNYNNLTINKAAGTAEIDSSVNISGDLLISSGELHNYAAIDIEGNVTIAPGSTFKNNDVIHIGGDWANSGTYLPYGSGVYFDGTGTQYISASPFGSVFINKPSGTAILTGDLAISGNLVIDSGTLDLRTYSIIRDALGGFARIANGATAIIGGNNGPSNFSAYHMDTASTIIFNSADLQFLVLTDVSFGNIILRNSGMKMLLSDAQINGSLTIDSGTVFDASTYAITLGGHWTNNGTFIPSASTVLYAGLLKNIVGNTTFNKVTVTGSYTILNDVTLNGLLDITNTGSLTGGPTIHTVLHGDFINSGSLYTLGTTTYSGNVVQTLSLINAISTVALTVNFNGSVSPVLNSTSAPQFGYLNINNTGGINPSVDWTILYALTIGSGASFNGGISTHNILGGFTNNGTVTSTGVLNFIPSSTVTLNLGNDFSSTGRVEFGGAGATTLAGTPDSMNDVVISNTNGAGITPSSDWSIDNNLTVNSSSILNAGSYLYSIGGNLSNTGTINSGTSTFLFNGVTAQSILTASNFNNLTINKAADSATLLSGANVTGEIKMLAGTVNLNSYGLTITGTSTFKAGAVNNGAIVASGPLSVFEGTSFGATVNATSDALYLNGSTFNNTATLTKTGAADIISAGGNIFNSSTTILNSGTGYFALGNTAADIFNNSAIFTNTGSNVLHLAYNASGNQYNGNVTFNNTGTGSSIRGSQGNMASAVYNGNIILNNTSTGGIYFGATGGLTTLAASKTITIGATGFAAGTLLMRDFTQLGSTSQALTLTGTAMLQSGPSNTFNGGVTFISPQVLLNGNTFVGTASIRKSGATQNNSLGGNTFAGAATLTNTGSGIFLMGFSSADIFNDLSIVNTGTSSIQLAHNTAGHQFNGNISLRQTSGAGIYFGAGTGTATLASGKALSTTAGFSSGMLNIARFTQLGPTAQSLTLTGTSLLQMGPSVVFNGTANFAAGQLVLNGTVFNNVTSLSKTGATDNTSTGGNIFNGITTLQNSGAGSLDLGNTLAETFNADLTINNTGTSRVQIGISSAGNIFNGKVTVNYGGNTSSTNFIVARNAGSTATINGDLVLNCTNLSTSSGIIIANDGAVAVNGNVLVSSTSGRGILFGAASGSVVLGNGFTIADAGAGKFTTGTLTLSRFTQTGTTAQNIALTGTANLLIGPASQFNGPLVFTAPQLFLNGATYNNTAVLRKNGATDNTSTGGNIFNAAATISNNGTGLLRLANTTADDFNANATFIQTGSGLVQPAYGNSYTIAGNLSTEGTATPIVFGTTVTLNGTAAQSIISSLSPTFNNLVISNTLNTVSAAVNINVAGNLSVTSGTFNLAGFTSDRLTTGGSLTLANAATLRIGGTNTIPARYAVHSVGATSTVEYSGTNQSVGLFNSAQHYGNLLVSGAGTQMGAGDITVRNNVSVTAGSLNINTHTLKIGGSVSSDNNLIAESGTIEMNGLSAQSIPAATFFSNVVKGLTINNTAGVTLGGPVNLMDVLTISGGSLASDGHLTLKSTDTGTARVAPITSVSATPVTGNVTAERYVPGRRKYRLITSPVTTSTSAVLAPGQESLSIWANWQNGGVNTSANSGNFITGGSGADGFDTQTPNASLFTYDDAGRRYVGYTTANGKNTMYTPLKAGVAYFMFVYGDRLNSVNATYPHNTVIGARGKLKTGDQVYTTSSEIPLTGVIGRFTLLGNPFASPINWATIPKSGLENTYWGWDPNLGSTGGYITVNTTGTVTLQAPYSGTTGLDVNIQSGQGFFVKTSGSSPVLTIREQDKVPDFNGNAFRTAGTNNLPLLAVNLQYTAGSNKILADGVLAAFDDSFSNRTGTEDAGKMSGTAESVAILNDTTLLSIDARPLPANNDTLYLNMFRLVKPQYTLQIFARQMEGSGVQAYLEDRYLNTTQFLQMQDTNNVVFNVNTAIAASFDINRFRIIFQSGNVMLPSAFISVKAGRKNNEVQVEWEMAEQSTIARYEIERSVNGINFKKEGEVTARGANSNQNYRWLDIYPQTGNNYYSVKAVHNDGKSIMSRVVIVKMNTGSNVFQAFPNLVTNQEISIRAEMMDKGKYSMLVFNAQGQQLARVVVMHQGGAFNQLIHLNSVMPAGMYYLQIANEKETFNRTFYLQ